MAGVEQARLDGAVIMSNKAQVAHPTRQPCHLVPSALRSPVSMPRP